MDGQRFDSLARALARGASRRGLLRGLTGVVAGWVGARGQPAAAQQVYYLGAGDPCYDDTQCRGADTYLICSGNGFDYDGPLNCCALDGGRCGFDEGCCGGLSCLDGFCSAALYVDYPDPIDQGLNQTGSGFPPGQACISDYQCDNSFSALGIVYCADNGYVYGAYGGTRHCCRYEGGSCGGRSDDHSLCCGGLLCLSGQCGWG